MSAERSMVAYRVELIDGTTKSGALSVPGTDPTAACRCAVGLIRGSVVGKHGRPEPFRSFLPHEVEDITVQFIGPA